MLVGKPILSGDSDANQLELIWDLMGSPNDDVMPGWKQLPGGEHLTPRPRPGNIQNRFREYVCPFVWSRVPRLTLLPISGSAPVL